MALTKELSTDLAGTPLTVFRDPDTQALWFHGKEVCNHLELANPTQVIQRHVWPQYRETIAHGRGMPAWYVTEPGLYQLIFASNTQKSITFQRWVFEEVLPSIRKHGGYISSEATSEQVQTLFATHQEQVEAARSLVKKIPLDDPKILTVAKNIKALESLAKTEQLQQEQQSGMSKVLSKIYDRAKSAHQPLPLADFYRNINAIRTLAKQEGTPIAVFTINLCRELEAMDKGRIEIVDGKTYYSSI